MREMVKCKNCGEENYSDDIFCKNCKVRVSESLDKPIKMVKGEGYIDATKIVAWIELLCSCYMAFQSFSKASEINKYMYKTTDIAEELKSSMQMTGVYFLLGGIIIFVLLMAVHYIGKNVINMAKNQ